LRWWSQSSFGRHRRKFVLLSASHSTSVSTPPPQSAVQVSMSMDSTQKLKQFGPIVKFSTCIISNILVKTLLKIETARLQTISTIFSLNFDFGAIDQTIESKLSFEFCVYPSRYRFNRSSLLRSSHIDFIVYFLFYCSETAKRRSDSLSKVGLKVIKNFFPYIKSLHIIFKIVKHHLSEKKKN